MSNEIIESSSVSEPAEIVAVVVEEDVPIPLEDLNSLREDTKKLSIGMNIGCLELGRRLAIVNERMAENGKRIYKVWGYASFADYCERELGIFRSKGYTFITLYKHSQGGLLTSKQVEDIGWSKVTPLLPLIKEGVITKQNILKWLSKIEGKTFDEVREIASLARQKAKVLQDEEKSAITEGVTEDNDDADVGNEAPSKTTVSSSAIAPEEIYTLRIPLYKDQWENVQVALKKAERITGSDKQPWLLDCIALAFNSEAFSTKEESLEVLCKRIERVFGVDIIALHSTTKQTVFGDRLVKMLTRTENIKTKKDS